MRSLKPLTMVMVLSGLVLLSTPDRVLADRPPDIDSEAPVPGSEPTGRTHTQPTGDLTNAAVDWTCYLDVHHPHQSGHVPGTINVVGEINCEQVMPALTISTTLQKRSCTFWIFCSWSNVGPTGTVRNYNTDHVSSNSAAACVDGTYRGRSSATFVWPDGTSSSGLNYSASVSINC